VYWYSYLLVIGIALQVPVPMRVIDEVVYAPNRYLVIDVL
jgi:hypothetical protein